MSSYPNLYYCALSGQIMEDPSTDIEGNNYELKVIEDYLKSKDKSPITSNPLSFNQVARNPDLKEQIDSIRNLINDESRFRDVKLITSKNPSPLQEEEIHQQNEESSIQNQVVENIVNQNEPSLQISRLNEYVRIKVNTPQGKTRSKCDICCVIDVSGSMRDEITLKDSNGKSEGYGLTILDLVKHSVTTIIENLNDEDRLSLVSFTDKARIETELTHMDKAGKEQTITHLNSLFPLNSTNIWDGLLKGLQVMQKGSKENNQRDSFSSILLFTDGQPNIIPPKGHLAMLQQFQEANPEVNCSISTFGFGYNLDSILLDELSKQGNGSYAFIPDGSFVGTVFVNALSNIMATMAVDSVLCLENSEFSQFGGDQIQFETSKEEVQQSNHVLGGFNYQEVSWGLNLKLGNIQYGQSRDILVKMKNIDSKQALPYLRATLKYKTSSSQGSKLLEISGEGVNRKNDENVMIEVYRLQLVDTLKGILELISHKKAQEAQNEIKQLLTSIQEHPQYQTSKYLKDLSIDLSGQITEALANNEAFRKWGRHYLPSLCRAHQNQQCNNFKDPGVQHYGGELFSQIRDIADEIFLKIPAPVAFKDPNGGKVQMSHFYNCGGTCFSGDSLVTILNEQASPIKQTKKVSEICKGDLVLSPALNNQPSRVLCVVKTPCLNNSTFLVKLSDSLLITPYHPVRINQKWGFPCDISNAFEQPCNFVYSFALESGHTMEIGGIECVTYAHNFQENVVKHSYFGTENILNDLKSMKGWDQGYITLDLNCVVRDPISRLVVHLKGPANELNSQPEQIEQICVV